MNDLKSVSSAFEARLRAVLPGVAFVGESTGYFEEPRGRWQGRGLVVAPGSTIEISNVVAACHEARVPVVPYGGGTGLVGGQICGDGPVPVVLSLARMNRLRGLYREENVIEVDAGIVLAEVQQMAEQIGRLFPVSLASEGSAHIGGLLATNAGGLNVVRYGNARAQCLGLEVVLADGRIWDGMSRLRKDNTGYDLRDLMIGSEGSLGVITGASLRLMSRPADEASALFVIADAASAVKLLGMAQDCLGDQVTAFELINGQGIHFLDETGLSYRKVLADIPEWSILVRLAGAAPGEAQAGLEKFFEVAEAFILDGVLPQSQAQAQNLWDIREMIPEANRRIGAVSSHDISVPISKVPAFIADASSRISRIGDFRINCFGHLGDGNLHYNVFPAPGHKAGEYEELRGVVKEAVHDLVHDLGGSISAEHGVGRHKVGDLEKYGDPVKLDMMRSIKTALDPRGILNPGVVLRHSNGAADLAPKHNPA